MIIIGVDFHPEFQQIASVDSETGEFQEKRLAHREEAEKFYRGLAAASQTVRVCMEASGHGRWFERLVAELQFELWIGDAAEIRTRRVRKQKTDRQDAQLILKLMLKDDFPKIWVPSWENRDLRQLLWHRHRMVQARTSVDLRITRHSEVAAIATACAAVRKTGVACNFRNLRGSIAPF
jgi:transposase